MQSQQMVNSYIKGLDKKYLNGLCILKTEPNGLIKIYSSFAYLPKYYRPRDVINACLNEKTYIHCKWKFVDFNYE